MEWLYEILKKSNTCLSRTLHTYHKMGAFINNPKIKLTILWLTMDSALAEDTISGRKISKRICIFNRAMLLKDSFCLWKYLKNGE